MDATLLARIEFRQEIGTFTDAEREALLGQLVIAVRRIQAKQWEHIDVAELSAPEEAPQIIVPNELVREPSRSTHM